MITVRQLLAIVSPSHNFIIYDLDQTTVLFDSAFDSVTEMLQKGLIDTMESSAVFLDVRNDTKRDGIVFEIYTE